MKADKREHAVEDSEEVEFEAQLAAVATEEPCS